MSLTLKWLFLRSAIELNDYQIVKSSHWVDHFREVRKEVLLSYCKNPHFLGREPLLMLEVKNVEKIIRNSFETQASSWFVSRALALLFTSKNLEYPVAETCLTFPSQSDQPISSQTPLTTYALCTSVLSFPRSRTCTTMTIINERDLEQRPRTRPRDKA